MWPKIGSNSKTRYAFAFVRLLPKHLEALHRSIFGYESRQMQLQVTHTRHIGIPKQRSSGPNPQGSCHHSNHFPLESCDLSMGFVGSLNNEAKSKNFVACSKMGKNP